MSLAHFTRQAAAATCLMALLAAPALAAKVEAVPVDASFQATERAASLLKVSGADSGGLKGISRAAISSFQVEFVTKGAASASSYEIGRSGSANTNMQITMVGLGAADYQHITDVLHAEFERDLQAQGITVVPTAQVLASPAYQKMAASGKPSPADTRTKDTWSTVYAPAGLGVYGVGSSSTAFALLAGFTAMSDVSATMFANQELAKELDAALLVVRLVVNFVDLKSSDSSWFGRSSGTASVKGEVAPSVTPASMMQVVRPSGVNVTLALQAPLLMDSGVFSQVKDTSSVAANVGLAVLQLAIGKGGSSSVVEKEAVADPARYRAVVAAGAGNARAMFMERLRAGQ